MQSALEAQSRLHASMLAQERESETRKARLEVLERFTSEHLSDAMLRLPAETQNLHQRVMVLEELNSKSQLESRTLASMIDNHQEWQYPRQRKNYPILRQISNRRTSKPSNLQRLLPQRSEEKVLKHSLFIVSLNNKTPKNANFINFVFSMSHMSRLSFSWSSIEIL